MAQPAAGSATSQSFGRLLRRWREVRRKSQLDLAVEAEISSRHLSFLETARAQPSRDMVLLLANVLEVPLRERNVLLTTAGYAPMYRETELAAPELAHVKKALDFILTQQEPYPALVVDRHWNLMLRNEAASRLLRLFIDPTAMGAPLNVMRLTFHPQGLRPCLVNWEAVAGPLIQQIHRETVGGVPDEGTTRLLEELLAYSGVPRRWRTPDPNAQSAPLLFLDLRKDDLRLRLFSTITTLGTPQDITLQELRIECFFPADAATEALTRRLAADAPGSVTPATSPWPASTRLV